MINYIEGSLDGTIIDCGTQNSKSTALITSNLPLTLVDIHACALSPDYLISVIDALEFTNPN